VIEILPADGREGDQGALAMVTADLHFMDGDRPALTPARGARHSDEAPAARRVVERLDDYQQRHRWVGLTLAVVYKFIDDQGTYLAALITYYGFVSLFLLLLLLLVTILGFALHGDPALQQQILHSALRDFPIIGDQNGQNIHSLHGSVPAVIIGILARLYGGLGVTQAGQHALDTVWAVPRAARPDTLRTLVRGLTLLVLVAPAC
jgi:uncharacterized BrkB/YihY/UPF0761 family membrane protein